MAKPKVKAKRKVKQQTPDSFRKRWLKLSFAEKAMLLFSILIVASMVLAPLASLATSHGG